MKEAVTVWRWWWWCSGVLQW